ncbi:MAG: TadE/TadG family type IV pilus assembly protein [Isosphaeraceae bacterium]
MLIQKRITRRDRSGTSAVEFALIAPIFVAMMMGQLESSRLGMVSQLITTAAREGCRVAVVEGNTQADVQARVDATLAGSGISVGTVTPTCPSPNTWTSAPKGTPITVSLSVPYSQVSWLGTPFFLSGATVRASATFSSERP